jgi:hypothetical protein
MTVEMFGPTSLRRNDLKLLGQSRVNAKLRDLQLGRPYPEQLKIYGDSMYPKLSHLRSSYQNAVNTPMQIAENRALTKTRVSIEWNYMVTGNLYGIIRQKNKLRIMGNAGVKKLYTVCTIMRNCHVALYGSQTSNYFNLDA